MILHVEGLRWHDPISVVGAPSHSYGYGVVAPPGSWGRGIRNAAHCTPSTAFRDLAPPLARFTGPGRLRPLLGLPPPAR